MNKVINRIPLFQRFFGLEAAMAFGCYMAERLGASMEEEDAAVTSSIVEPSFFIFYALCIVFALASALLRSLAPFQAASFVAIIFAKVASGGKPLVCLVCGLCAALALLRRGFFVRRANIKACLLGACFVAAVFMPWVWAEKRNLFTLISCMLACGGLCMALATAASPAGRSILLWRKKETLKLVDFGLSTRERAFVLAYLGGKSMKVIASDNGVSSSTVRNTFSNAYAKLGIVDSHELRALGERFNVE